MTNVSKTIKELRNLRHLTQVQLADKAGISRQTVWNVERRNATTVYTFERLLNAMGFGLDIVPLESKDDWRLP